MEQKGRRGRRAALPWFQHMAERQPPTRKFFHLVNSGPEAHTPAWPTHPGNCRRGPLNLCFQPTRQWIRNHFLQAGMGGEAGRSDLRTRD